jgi:GntR family transcriptional regulator, rspAB operon transcriptional repressor
VVQTVSLDQVLNILEARLVNEPYCTSLAAKRATTQEITRMQELFGSATASLIRARDRESLMNLDRDFHRLISDAARNSVVADIRIMLHERSLHFWFIAFADDLQLRRIDDEHRAILSAIKQRNRAEAEAAMRAHIESSRNHIMRAI